MPASSVRRTKGPRWTRVKPARSASVELVVGEAALGADEKDDGAFEAPARSGSALEKVAVA